MSDITRKIKKFAWLPAVMKDGKIIWLSEYTELYYKISDNYKLISKQKQSD